MATADKDSDTYLEFAGLGDNHARVKAVAWRLYPSYESLKQLSPQQWKVVVSRLFRMKKKEIRLTDITPPAWKRKTLSETITEIQRDIERDKTNEPLSHRDKAEENVITLVDMKTLSEIGKLFAEVGYGETLRMRVIRKATGKWVDYKKILTEGHAQKVLAAIQEIIRNRDARK
jgi:hypothetical protein